MLTTTAKSQAALHGRIAPPHRTHASEAIGAFCRKNIVFLIALTLAAVTSLIVKPDAQYLEYFDFRTLSCLFCTLAVVCALGNIGFFSYVAERCVCIFKNARMCTVALVYITFIGSMFLANDMALLTFLPLGCFILSSTGREKDMAFTFVMQNISANLGGMLTPFGNPQNLYLYSHFGIPNGEFVSIMLPPFAVSIALITVCCMFVKPESLTLKTRTGKPDTRRTVLYLALFVLAIAVVFRGVPYWIGLIVIVGTLALFDRKALLKVDYPLLLTFAAFFVFAGNMSRIPQIKELLGSLMQLDTLLVSAASCQFISNVPSAILLSQFTGNYRELLLGVNIGGVGTLIASLASLITFREYCLHDPHGKGRYIRLFSLINFAFLFILLAFSVLIRAL